MRFRITAIVLLMITTYMFMWSVIVPSLPIIADHYMRDTKEVQLVITLYILGLGLSQLLYGSASDIFGRKIVLQTGCCILIVGSLITVMCLSIEVILLGRFVQGIGAGCFSVVCKSIARDISDVSVIDNLEIIDRADQKTKENKRNNENTLKKIVSHNNLTRTVNEDSFIRLISSMMMVAVLMQIISPVFGASIATYLSWKAPFYAMLVYSLITTILITLFLPETNFYLHTKSLLKIKTIWNNIRLVVHDFNFWYHSVISGLTLANITIFQTSSPFVLQNQLGLSIIEFGAVSIFNVSGFCLGSLRLSKFKIGSPIITILMGLCFMTIATCIMVCLSKLHNIFAIMVPMFIFSIGSGIVLPSATGRALVYYKESIGFASSVIGSIQMLFAVAACTIISHFIVITQFSMALEMFVLSLGMCAFYIWGLKRETKKLETT